MLDDRHAGFLLCPRLRDYLIVLIFFVVPRRMDGATSSTYEYHSMLLYLPKTKYSTVHDFVAERGALDGARWDRGNDGFSLFSFFFFCRCRKMKHANLPQLIANSGLSRHGGCHCTADCEVITFFFLSFPFPSFFFFVNRKHGQLTLLFDLLTRNHTFAFQVARRSCLRGRPLGAVPGFAQRLGREISRRDAGGMDFDGGGCSSIYRRCLSGAWGQPPSVIATEGCVRFFLFFCFCFACRGKLAEGGTITRRGGVVPRFC